MPRNKKQGNLSILEKKRERLLGLEEQVALEGFKTDPSVEIEIRQIKDEIVELERELKDSGGYHLTKMPLLLEKYNAFFDQFGKCLPTNEDDSSKFRKSVLASLGCALDVEYVFVARDNGARWEVVDIYNAGEKVKEPNSVLNADIQTLIYRLVRDYNDNQENAKPGDYINVSMARHKDSDRRHILAYFPDSSPSEVLVLHGIKINFEIDTVIAAILNTLIEVTKNVTFPRASTVIQSMVLNTLKRDFFYVSRVMYEKQFELFREQLQNLVMHYEPIVSLSHYPYICRWEALVRNRETLVVPKNLFETCELWGRRFQIELDIYCLNLAVENYRKLPDELGNNNYRQRRVGDILPLSVNVYPETLIRTAYKNAVLDLAKMRLIPLDKLTLEISEKRPLPFPENPNLEQDEIDWFRDRLIYYTNMGITFAIDDYGVGFASASRLSRLEPAMIKIDRDALLHSRGKITIEQVLQFERESMGKIIVVIEGFDDESSLSLAELYQMGVRYVQGHDVGDAVLGDNVYRLNLEQEQKIITKLGL